MYVSKNEEQINKLQKRLKKSKTIASDLQEEYQNALELVDILTDIVKQLKEREHEDQKEYERKTGECIHVWQYDGRDSHYSYDKCIKCGKTSKC